jgi:WD40 repeat protein
MVLNIWQRRPRRALPPPAYDAFVSYSHARSALIAQALQYKLERFGRRWPQPRVLRIFRDKTNLAASPGLWTSIERALAASRWFILMASPAAAASTWVQREIEYWLGDPDRRARMLIVLVDGTLEWDGRRYSETSTAAPPILRTAFEEEPLHIDLTSAGDGAEDYSAAGMEAAVASLAAQIQGRSLDEVVGVHLREQRRSRRLAWTAITTLAVLTVASLVASGIAVGQTREANRQADRALTRQLAAQSVSNLGRRLDLAQLLAVEAYRIRPDEQPRSALLQAVMAQPALVRYIPLGEPVTALAGSADGKVVVAGTAGGHVVRWTTDRAEPERIMSLRDPVSAVALDRTGTRVVAADDLSTSLWTSGAGPRSLESAPDKADRLVGISPSGRHVVFSGSQLLNGIDLVTNRSFRTPESLGASDLVVPDDGHVVLVEYAYGGWQRLRLPDLSKVDEDTVGFGVHNSAAAVSPDGSLLTYTNGAEVVSLWRTRTPTRDVTDSDLEAGSHGPTPDALAVSPDNRYLATAVNGSIYLSGIVARGQPITAPRQLDGNTTTERVTFLGDARHLLSASGDAVALWDTDQISRIATRSPVEVPISCNACSEPWMAVSADGRLAAFTAMFGDEVVVSSWADRRQLLRLKSPTALDYQYGPSIFLPDGRTLVVTTATGLEAYGPFGDDRTGPGKLWAVSDTEPSPVMAVAPLPDHQVLVARLPNGLETRDAGTGRLLHRATAEFDPRDAGDVQNSAMAAVDRSGRFAALVGGDAVTVVDVRTGRKKAAIGGSARAVRFGGDVLAVAFDDGRIETHRPADGGLIRVLPGNLDTRNAFAMSSDGSRLASAGDDGTVRIFDLTSSGSEALGALNAGSNGISYHVAMSFTDDDKDLIVAFEGGGSADHPGEVQRWLLSPADWVDVACRTAGRPLTAAEWTTYVGTEPPPERSCAAR